MARIDVEQEQLPSDPRMIATFYQHCARRALEDAALSRDERQRDQLEQWAGHALLFAKWVIENGGGDG